MMSTFGFGYLHYAIFASAGALAAGIEVALAQAGDHPPLPEVVGRATTTVPVAVFLLGVWVLALRPALPRRTCSVERRDVDDGPAVFLRDNKKTR